MIVQIYAATDVDTAIKMANLGVDQVGFVAGDYGEVHGELTFQQARAIVDALRGKATSSALTMSTDVAEIMRMGNAVNPDIIHISSDTDAVGVAAMQQLRAALPRHILLMKAIHVDGPKSVDAALQFAPVSDILLLDTKITGFPGVGATGATHDWNISHQIVKQVGNSAKIILAGGLTAENVANAINAVQPWGVDSNTRTNIPGDPIKKDMNRVSQFVKQAKRVDE